MDNRISSMVEIPNETRSLYPGAKDYAIEKKKEELAREIVELLSDHREYILSSEDHVRDNPGCNSIIYKTVISVDRLVRCKDCIRRRLPRNNDKFCWGRRSDFYCADGISIL